MKTFEKPNTSGGWKCPICKKDDEKEVVLIPIYGKEEGNMCEAEQLHLDCIELTYYPVFDTCKTKALNMRWSD